MITCSTATCDRLAWRTHLLGEEYTLCSECRRPRVLEALLKMRPELQHRIEAQAAANGSERSPRMPMAMRYEWARARRRRGRAS